MESSRSGGGLRAVAATAAVVLLAGALAAPSSAQPQLGAKWRGAITRADQDLQAGRSERVRKKMSRLLEEMKSKIESGPGAGWYLGSAAAMRAVAEAGLGNERQAAWDWHMAVSLHSEYEGMDLARYGEAGAVLRTALEADAAETVANMNPSFEPPKRLQAPEPAYPLAKKAACLEESIVIDSAIGRDGVPFRPRLMTPSYPVMGLAAMETLRDWRFEPARLAGEPTAVRFTLVTNFMMRSCASDAASLGRKLGAVKKSVE